jgi:hypothetical protein
MSRLPAPPREPGVCTVCQGPVTRCQHGSRTLCSTCSPACASEAMRRGQRAGAERRRGKRRSQRADNERPLRKRASKDKRLVVKRDGTERRSLVTCNSGKASCYNLPWRRPRTGCPQCGAPYGEEPAPLPHATTSHLALAANIR